MDAAGIEPVTPCMSSKYSNHLSYASKKWWTIRDSNPRPHTCEACALPTELIARIINPERYRIPIGTRYFCTGKPDWSGRRDSNSRRSPWQGDALPLSHSRKWCLRVESNRRHRDFQSLALPTELQRHLAL